MPLSGNFAIQSKSLFQSSLNLHLHFGASRFFTGGSAIAYPENVENSTQNYPENAGDYTSESTTLDTLLYCEAKM